MSQPIVTCDNLVKIYKVADLEVVALQGLDLEVAAGEMIAIVGASGSGKSTLLNILSALDTPSAGRCIVDDYDLTRLNETQRIQYRRFVIGHIWQQSGRNLLPELSLAENVELPQLLGGIASERRLRHARELLELVGLEGMNRKRPDEISGGEQQRAAIAVAIANEPKLLLADEPTGELDSVTASQIFGLLRTLSRELGLTIITVTHDVAMGVRARKRYAAKRHRQLRAGLPCRPVRSLACRVKLTVNPFLSTAWAGSSFPKRPWKSFTSMGAPRCASRMTM